MDLAAGTVLLGKYRVDELLGTGGMGRVVRASHLYLQQSFAIKLLLPQMAESPSTVARFLREAQATSRLKSEHTARVLDVGTMPDGIPFMVMEYLEGNDLNQILRHHGPQTPQVVCDLMLQACEGIAEAHSLGIVHRDIKPSNFFITKRPDGSMLLKILDFGISKTPVGFEELTGTQTVIGTPSYMAPEQMKSGKQTDMRSDIWSMGVVMYQLLEGRPPFSGDSYVELVLKVGSEPPTPLQGQLPPGLKEVILRCLEKDPRQRHQNVGELARSLAPFASDPISAAQIAGRTTRILQQRPSQNGGFNGVQGMPTAAGGGLSTPVPLSPAQLTPRSWPPTATGLSQGKGQLTYQTGRGRGWLIAGALSLVILAGAGGFIANQLMNKERDVQSSASPPTATAAPTQMEVLPNTETGSGSAGSGSDAGSAALATGSAAGSDAGSAATWKPTAVTPTIAPTTPDPKADTKTVAATKLDPKVDTKATTTTAKVDTKATTTTAKVDTKTTTTTAKVDPKTTTTTTTTTTTAKVDPKATTTTAKVDTKTTTATKVDTKTTTATKVDTKTTTATKVDPKATTTKVDTATKPAPKTTTATKATKPDTKTKTKPKGDLFDSRH